MALSNPGLSELVTTTLRNRAGEFADNFTNNNAILRKMRERGNTKPLDGGRTIVRELVYAANGTAQSYSGYDPINITPQDVITAAEYPWAQYAVSVSISGIEERANSGKEAIVSLLKERTENAIGSLENKLASDLYGDGSGNGGRAIYGLALLVSTSPTTGIVGGIDRSTTAGAFWRNQKFSASTDGGAAISAANVMGYMNKLRAKLIRGKDQPDMIITDNVGFTTYQSSLQAIQRITNPTNGFAGFPNLDYCGVPLILDGGYGGGAPASTFYFMNTKYLSFQPHRRMNFAPIGDDRMSTNQDAVVRLVGFQGQLTMSNAFLQGVLTT